MLTYSSWLRLDYLGCVGSCLKAAWQVLINHDMICMPDEEEEVREQTLAAIHDSDVCTVTVRCYHITC